jgi:RTX calcium-binding nonapeptide repeat (4 copies)/Bacterial cadherin-like domain
VSRNPVDGAEVTHVKVNGITGGTLFREDGVTQINNGDFVTFAGVDGGMKFTPSANANGASVGSVTVQASTSAGDAGLGGVPVTATIDVNAVNDAPAGADTTKTINEDAIYTFAAADFGFSDAVEGDALAAVKITTLPGAGTLTNNGVAVSGGDFVSTAAVNAGHLVFTPVANGNGTPYASFTFQVQDDGGTATGGVDLDPTANTFRFDITPANDPPTDITGTLAANEFAANNTIVGTLAAADVDSGSFTFSIVPGQDAGGRFSVDSDGTVRVANGLLLDFEQTISHTIRVEVDDGAGGLFEKDLQVTVNDINPEDVTGDGADNTFVGGALGDTLRGMGGADHLFGGAGNDVLDGGTGDDETVGGDNNDFFVVDSPLDIVTENPNEGQDIEFSSVDRTISANVEVLVLNGPGLTGTGSANNDVLQSFGFAATMIGGGGDDTYWVTNPGDVVQENSGGGTDYVVALVDYTIPAEVEKLIMYGSGLTGTGSGDDDILISEGGPNTLVGLDGDDFYYVHNSGDMVQEAPGEGQDFVIATDDYAIPANVEVLVMNGSGLTGTGSSGSDVLQSMGGANTLVGGDGDDTYWVTNIGDVVQEAPNQGTDYVVAQVDYTLPANAEVLIMYGTGLTGTGSAGNDVLQSRGTNTLAGAGGNDTFVLFAGGAHGNTITDFGGNGAAAGDLLALVGFGPGATLHQVNATDWQVTYSGGHETFTLGNGASIHPSDYQFFG